MKTRTIVGLAALALLGAAACGLYPDLSPSTGSSEGKIAGADFTCALDTSASEFHRTASGGYDLMLSACGGRFRSSGHLAVLNFVFEDHLGVYPLPRCVAMATSDSGPDAGLPDSGADAGTLATDVTCSNDGARTIVDRWELLEPRGVPAIASGELELTDTSSHRLRGELRLRLADGSELRARFDLREATELEPRASHEHDWDD